MPSHDSTKQTGTSVTTPTTDTATTTAEVGGLSAEQATALDLQESHGNAAAFALLIDLTVPDSLIDNLVDYDTTMNEHLGADLFAAVKDNLAESKVCSVADTLIDTALRKAAGKLTMVDGSLDEASIGDFTSALTDELQAASCEFSDKHKDSLLSGVQAFAGENPASVVGIALLAAAGAYAADMDMPSLSGSFGLTDSLSIGTEATLGTLQNATLETISTELRRESGDLGLALGLEHDLGSSDTSVGLSLDYRW